MAAVVGRAAGWLAVVAVSGALAQEIPPQLPICPELDGCPVPEEVAALLQAAGEYGLGDYPPCVEIRAGGQVCVMPAGQPHPAP